MSIKRVICPNCEEQFSVNIPPPMEHRCTACGKLLSMVMKLVDGETVIRPKIITELKD